MNHPAPPSTRAEALATRGAPVATAAPPAPAPDQRPDAPRGPRALVPGLLLVGAATLLVLAGARLVPTVSPLVVALVLGALVAPVLGRLATTRRGGATVAATRPGVAWTSRVVLRVGVVLLGFQLSLPEVLGLGWRGLVVVTTTLAVTFAGTLALGRVLRVPRVTTLLVATGFSVCGAAAISAMQGVVDRPGRTPDEVREDDDGVATALALVTVYGTLAIVVLPWLAGLLGLTDDRAGLWIGASVQEVAQVVTAAGTISAPALATATVAKLARVALLAPLVAVAGVVVARGARRAASALATTSTLGASDATSSSAADDGESRGAGAGARRRRVAPVPWFVVGFVAAVALRSLGVVPAPVLAVLVTASTLAFVAAMFALGLGVDVPTLVRTGRRSLVLGALSAVLVTATALVGVLLLA
ncbi:YeiH family protein [Cellulosimicrobium funkei]|uniref:Putative sulfate exporter family transporter n=1 Tax=Cellulosimicrobium funkei TaxID=264251 RepID=A0A4Y8R2R7_9MICO|nr:putative sulfate exporter family transporter [Cellulosimicrobium funkei]TFF10356.1 putative sulfate exporter family transporter [Cellulosimicrobium funkei]TGA73751.1 putative sulfate exporter family transporter [Cellulosimicrobium terreum]